MASSSYYEPQLKLLLFAAALVKSWGERMFTGANKVKLVFFLCFLVGYRMCCQVQKPQRWANTPSILHSSLLEHFDNSCEQGNVEMSLTSARAVKLEKLSLNVSVSVDGASIAHCKPNAFNNFVLPLWKGAWIERLCAMTLWPFVFTHLIKYLCNNTSKQACSGSVFEAKFCISLVLSGEIFWVRRCSVLLLRYYE